MQITYVQITSNCTDCTVHCRQYIQIRFHRTIETEMHFIFHRWFRRISRDAHIYWARNKRWAKPWQLFLHWIPHLNAIQHFSGENWFQLEMHWFIWFGNNGEIQINNLILINHNSLIRWIELNWNDMNISKIFEWKKKISKIQFFVLLLLLLLLLSEHCVYLQHTVNNENYWKWTMAIQAKGKVHRVASLYRFNFNHSWMEDFFPKRLWFFLFLSSMN